jgi:hypothetical protein
LGSTLHLAPCISLYHHAERARAPLCGDTIGGRMQRMWVRVGYSTVAWVLLCMRGAVRVVDRGRAKTGGVAVWCGRAVFNGAAAFDQDIGGWDMSKLVEANFSACIFARGSTLHPAPCIPLYHHAERARPPLCGDAIGGRSACGSAWSIVRLRGCCLAWGRARGGPWVG